MEDSSSPSKGDSPENDLDYFSRPENYTSSNFQAMQRVIVSKEQKTPTKDEENDGKPKGNIAFLYNRYRNIFPTDEEFKQMQEETKRKEREAAQEEGFSVLKFTDPEQMSPDDRWSSSRSTRLEAFGLNISSSPSSTEGVARTSITGMVDKQTQPIVLTSGPQSGPGIGPPGGLHSGKPRVSLTPRLSMTPLSDSPSIISQLGKKSISRSRYRFGSVTQEVKAKLARERFKHAVQLVRTACRLLAALMKKTKTSDDTIPTFTAIVKEYSYENLKNSGLSFDPTYFRAKVEISLSNEVKSILSLSSEARTPEQIQTAMYGLRSLRSFAEYPLHMQEKLCKVAWFTTVSPKRKIIRQGHLAENFYFILSGQAVVTILVKDPNTGESVTRTATIMRKGMSFGELALLHHSRRTATVTTQENVQLLTIGRDDFFDIFMSGQGPGEIPDHIKFVGQLEFMKHWPLERLIEHPEHCLLHFFKRSAVIVRDSLRSDWLYIVKSGSCQVIKTLKGVTPKLGRRTLKREPPVRLPKLGTGEPSASKVDTGMPPAISPVDMSDTLQKAVFQFKELIWKRKVSLAPEPSVPVIKEMKSLETQTKEVVEMLEPKPPQEEKKEEKSTRPGFSKSKFDKFKADAEAYFKKKVFEPAERMRERKEYKPPRIRRRKKTPPKVVAPPSKPPPVYVQVEALNPRDVFGLETIQFDNELEEPKTTVCLVSRGAECIMLSKEFFAKHANEAVKQMLRKHTRPYPEGDTFQENLQTKEDWNLYKATLIEDIVKLQRKKKDLCIPLYA